MLRFAIYSSLLSSALGGCSDSCDVSDYSNDCCGNKNRNACNTFDCNIPNNYITLEGPRPLESCGVIRKLHPFICFKKHSPTIGRLYYEFDLLGVIFTEIGIHNASNLLKDDEVSPSSTTIIEAMRGTYCYDNFDGRRPFFYNCDVCRGAQVCERIYDTHFVNWLLTRWALFLDAYLNKGYRFNCTEEGVMTLDSNGTSIHWDIINLPPCDDSTTFGPCTDAMFNELISNTIIRQITRLFLKIIKSQILVCLKHPCAHSKRTTFNTYCAYVDTILFVLEQTCLLNQKNHDIKVEYLGGKTFFAFITLPVVITNNPTPPTTVHTYKYLLVDEASVPIEHFADFCQ